MQLGMRMGPHPNVIHAVSLANALRPETKFASVVCSYGWGGKAIEIIAGLIPNLKVEMLPTMLCQGAPREADLQAADALAEAIALKHRESGLLH